MTDGYTSPESITDAWERYDRRGPKPHDYTGERFGYLTVIGFAGRSQNSSRTAFWTVRCDCGTIKAIRQTSLTTKRSPVRSCGCKRGQLRKERLASEGRPYARLIDYSIIGQRFGRLTVVSYHGRKDENDRDSLWLCHCDCGNTSISKGRYLKSVNGYVSCGCLKGWKDRVGPTFIHGLSSPNRDDRHVIHRRWRQIINGDVPVADEFRDPITYVEYIESLPWSQSLIRNPRSHSIERIDRPKGWIPGNIHITHKGGQGPKSKPKPDIPAP